MDVLRPAVELINFQMWNVVREETFLRGGRGDQKITRLERRGGVGTIGLQAEPDRQVYIYIYIYARWSSLDLLDVIFEVCACVCGGLGVNCPHENFIARILMTGV